MVIELASGGTQDILSPRIVVVGVGGGGCNAVNNMIESNLQGIEFLAANTDAQSLRASKAQRKLQLGSDTTAGLGSGAQPDVGRRAAQESAQDIRDALEGCNMLFIAAGMGGGTGTGAAPVFAEIAQTMGILTIAVVTKPFEFEGGKRLQAAVDGLSELQKYVGTLIVIPNQNLFRIANDKTTFSEAFKMADEVLCSGVRSITDLIIIDGLVNLDFADICTVMNEMGKAMMGTGEAEGDNRALRAAEAAITNPLLEDGSLRGAKEVMVNITAGRDVGLHEIDEAIGRIRREAGEDAYVHFGAALDEAMHGTMRISVVATGMQGGGQQALALDGHINQQAQDMAQEGSLNELSPAEEQKITDDAGMYPQGLPDGMGLAMSMAADSHAPMGTTVAATVADTETSAPTSDSSTDLSSETNAADNNNDGHNRESHVASAAPMETAAPASSTPQEERMESAMTGLHQALQWPTGDSAVESTEQPTGEPTGEPTEETGGESEAQSHEAFIPPAAHKVGDSSDRTEYAAAGSQASSEGIGAQASTAPDDANDEAEAVSSEEKSHGGIGASIFALWRNHKSPAAAPASADEAAAEEKPAPEAHDESEGLGETSPRETNIGENIIGGNTTGETSPEPVAASEQTPETSPETSDETSPETSDDDTPDEDVVVLRERRFLPEDEAPSDEMQAVADEEEDSNLLRIPAFLRR